MEKPPYPAVPPARILPHLSRVPAVPLALAFLLGSLAGRLGGYPAIPAAAGLVLSTAAASPFALLAGGFSAGILCAVLPGDGLDTPSLPPGEGPWDGRVRSSGESAFGCRWVRVSVDEAPGQGSARADALLRLEDEAPRTGSRIRFRCRLSPAEEKGGLLTGRLQEGGWVEVGEDPVGGRLERIRETIRSRAEGMGEEGGVLRALALGETEGLSPRTLWDFRVTGTYHLLAVSGVHVGAVLLLAFLMVRPLILVSLRFPGGRLFPALAFLVGSVAVLFYLALARDSSSALRAALFGGITLGGLWAAREPSLPNTIAVSFLAIAAFSRGPQPDISLALSLAGCAGIAASWRREDTFLVRLVRISLGACLFTAPLVSLAFRGLPVLAPVWNLLVGVSFDLLLIPAAVLGDFLAFPWPAAAHAIFSFWRYPAVPLLFLLRQASEASLFLPLSPPGAWASAASAAASAFFWWRRRGAFGAGVLSLLAVAAAGWGGNQLWDLAGRGRLKVTFPGFGQADLALLRTREGPLLIDAGPPGWEGVPPVDDVLAREAVGKVRALILTHPHPDHAGGSSFLLGTGRVEELLLPDRGGLGPWKEILSRCPPATRVRFLQEGDRFRFGEADFLVLGPPGPESGETRAGPKKPGGSRDANRDSLVLLLRWEGCSALFAADAPWDGMLAAWREAAPLHLLKVPHHGSAGGGFPAHLPSGMRTKAAVFCARADGEAPLPAKRVLAAFHLAGIPFAVTGNRGVRVILDPGGPVVMEQGGR